MLTVKKLMLESLLHFRFRGRTQTYEELLIALENIIIDRVSTVQTTKQRKDDTIAPMEIEMTMKDDSGCSRGELTSDSWTSRCKRSTREQAKAACVPERAKLEHTELPR